MSIKDEATTSKAEEMATFRVNVRLVLARVVVRDARGRTVGNLRKEDFEIFDNGKPQVISYFAAENLVSPAVAPRPTPAASNTTNPAAISAAIPERYLIYFFDDGHLGFGDLNRARRAAEHRVDTLAPTDRVAIFTSSGQITLDFTLDRAALHQALERLQPRSMHPMFGGETVKCPDISYYMADLIVNRNDGEALESAKVDDCSTSGDVVQVLAAHVLVKGQQETLLSIGALQDAVRRISAMPGQRQIIVVSPGFLTPQLEYAYDDVINRALRSQVIISALDARGLYTVDEQDISTFRPPEPLRIKLDRDSASRQADVLAVLANSTGGTFFHNNNDMDEGFRRVADAPESYVLGFTPQSLKMDGKFHTLRVNLKAPEKYDLQVRPGYYAPDRAADPAELAKREIEEEMLSSEELHDLPVELRTQFFKVTENTAKLTVMARLDVKRLHYKKEQGRNQNDVTVVMALFDHNGNFLQANQKLLQMRWKDETLQAKSVPGITLRTNFEVKPGSYKVRLVARDGEQQLMSAENGAVEIP